MGRLGRCRIIASGALATTTACAPKWVVEWEREGWRSRFVSARMNLGRGFLLLVSFLAMYGFQADFGEMMVKRRS